jgi:hypothetical protein
MKHRRIAGMIDLFEVSDPGEIEMLSNYPVIDRNFDLHTCPFNWLILKRSLCVLSLDGIRFPTMTSRSCPSRARTQDELARTLDQQVEEMKAGPASLERLANWISGMESSADVGILAQQLLGTLFRRDFVATGESWDAALVLVKAPRSSDIPTLLWWFVSGKVKRAKRLLAGMVGNDLSAVNAIGIAVHNIVKGLHYMRTLYCDAGLRDSLTAESAANQCLRAPVSVYRQSTRSGTIFGTAFAKHSLFVLSIGAACQLPEGRSLVFMEDSWSKCPASRWVPALFEGIWRRATTATPSERAQNAGFKNQERSRTILADAAANGDEAHVDA